MNKDLLELYSDYLLSSFTHVTATGLSRMSAGEVSYDRITRFLASEEMNSRTLWRLVKPLVRQVEDDEGVLIIDDTIEEKPYNDESELICWHYDHSVEEYHKSLKSNASLAKSPTKTIRTQGNHVFASIWAFVKLERMKLITKMNHFALRSRLCVKAVRAAFRELLQDLRLSQAGA